MKIFIKLFFIGSLTSLIFPPFFLLPIGFITIPIFFNYINKISSNKYILENFLKGWSFGFGLNLCLFYWLKNPFLIEEETKNLFFLSYFYILYSSCYFGIFSVIINLFNNNNIRLIISPLIFVILEIIKSKLFLNFPWNLFAHVISNNIYLINPIKYIGIFGISYFVIIIFLLPIPILNIFNKQNVKFNIYYIIINILIIILFIFFSNNQSFQSKLNKESNFDVILYQNNTKQIDKWDLDKKQNRFDELINFIENNSNNNNHTLIIFSETEIPYIVKDNDNLLKFLQSKLDKNTTILIGGIRKNHQSNDYYNSFFSIDYQDISYFDKKFLVPFGEYIPLKKFFPFITKLTVGNKDFTKGEKERNIKLFNDLNFIPTICYENIFFEKIINKTNYKNELIINITNDAWFGKYQGPYQHFYQSVLSSIEYNKYLIRVSNNGISAIVDNNGKVLIHTRLNEKEKIKYNLIMNTSDKIYFFDKKYFFIYLYFIILTTILTIYQFYLRNDNK